MIPLHNARRFFHKACRQPEYAFRVFKRRLRAYLYYIYGKGRSSYPEALTLFLTHRCNLRCKMCGQWGEGGITAKQSAQYIKEELSAQELKAVIDDLAAFKPNITLFGGEPLLHSACLEIIRYIKSKGMHCLMITNGSLLKKQSEQIVDSGLDELNLSLDGKGSLHDEIRGMPGIFAEIMSGLKQINQYKMIKKLRKPLINLQCTISKYNYQYLEEMIDVADEANADSLTFHNLIFLESQVIEKQQEIDKLLNFSSSDWRGFVFKPEIKPELLYAKIKQILLGRYNFALDFYPNFSYQALVEYYRNPGYLSCEYPARCLSPWISAYIFPDGQVRPCLNFSYSYGNIKRDRFSKIWNNAHALRFRQSLKRLRIFPVCIRCTELYRY